MKFVDDIVIVRFISLEQWRQDNHHSLSTSKTKEVNVARKRKGETTNGAVVKRVSNFKYLEVDI